MSHCRKDTAGLTHCFLPHQDFFLHPYFFSWIMASQHPVPLESHLSTQPTALSCCWCFLTVPIPLPHCLAGTPITAILIGHFYLLKSKDVCIKTYTPSLNERQLLLFYWRLLWWFQKEVPSPHLTSFWLLLRSYSSSPVHCGYWLGGYVASWSGVQAHCLHPILPLAFAYVVSL